MQVVGGRGAAARAVIEDRVSPVEVTGHAQQPVDGRADALRLVVHGNDGVMRLKQWCRIAEDQPLVAIRKGGLSWA